MKLKCLIGSDVCYSYGNHPSECVYEVLPESKGSVPSNSNSSLLIVYMQQSFLDFQNCCPWFLSTMCICICIVCMKLGVFVCGGVLCNHTDRNNYFEPSPIFAFENRNLWKYIKIIFHTIPDITWCVIILLIYLYYYSMLWNFHTPFNYHRHLFSCK